MPRALRIDYSGLIYHVVNRGARRVSMIQTDRSLSQ